MLVSCKTATLFVCAIVAAASTSAFAATIQLIDPVTGLDSGWQASFPDSQDIDIVVDLVTPDAVFIQKFVDYEDTVGPGGLIPGVTIDFTQTLSDADTVPSIIILDEALTNLTGTDWDGFNILLANRDDVWFNVDLSSGFDTSPFANQVFTDFVDGNENRAQTLRMDGGIVPNLGTFFPGAGSGELWINVDLSGSDVTSFILKQVPVPEPAGIALLTMGIVLVGRRRSSHRRSSRRQ
jgi:hypothetical protein